MTIRRLLTLMVSTVAVLMLTATSAFAFHCYNTSRSENGNMKAAANSKALTSLEDIVGLAGFIASTCEPVEDEAAALATAVDDWEGDEGVDAGLIVIHGKTIMASGAEGTGVLHDGRGVDHSPDEVKHALHDFFGALEQAIINGDCTPPAP